jgi:hypothetical protein
MTTVKNKLELYTYQGTLVKSAVLDLGNRTVSLESGIEYVITIVKATAEDTKGEGNVNQK